VLACVKALRFASTRRAAGFGLDAVSAQATSGNCRRQSSRRLRDRLSIMATARRWSRARHECDRARDQLLVTHVVKRASLS
jgi:hypothetical protein